MQDCTEPFGVIDLGYTRFGAKNMPGYSVGAVYASIANLPRSLCFQKRFTTLLCVIPGPREPSLGYMNRVLEPIVDDIAKLEKGINVQVRGQMHKLHVRVLLAACDLPAQRKLLGSVTFSHNIHPCAYCGIVKDQINEASGYVPDNLPAKAFTREELLKAAFAYEEADLATRRQMEDTYGVRYSVSVFMRLIGVDHGTTCPVDPLHNSFLGLVKSFVTLLWEHDLFSKSSACEIGLGKSSLWPGQPWRYPAPICTNPDDHHTCLTRPMIADVRRTASWCAGGR